MTVFKFLFVLALAVPLAVFMWNYIKMQKPASKRKRRKARKKDRELRNRETRK